MKNNAKMEIKLLKEKTKYLKHKNKYDKRLELLNKKGVSKVYTTFFIEMVFLIAIELIVKVLLGTKPIDLSIFRIVFGSMIISYLIVIFTNNLKKRKIVLFIINLFISFYAWLQLGFMNYLGNFMSIGNAGQGTKVLNFIGDFLSSYDKKVYLIYIPFVFLAFYLINERKITRSGFNKKINFNSKQTCLYLFLVFVFICDLFYISIENKNLQNKYQAMTNAKLFKNPSNPGVTIKNYGTAMYLMLDLKNSIMPSSDDAKLLGKSTASTSETRALDDSSWIKIDEKEKDSTYSNLNKYFMNRKITEKNEYTGKFKNKNLIMIMMESVSEAVFDEKYKEHFPTLYYLHENGLTAVNNYSPKNNCATGESEMTSQISLYSIETTCTVNAYKDNVYKESLFNMFKNNNYYTSAYHDYTEKYYNRSVFEPNLGAEKYYGVEDLEMDYDEEYAEWPSDYVFMKNALPKFTNKNKFASFMVTVTAHTPYAVSSEFGDKYMEEFDDFDVSDSGKRYLSKIKEVDKALEYLLKYLKKTNKIDDTVIVLFGDHYPYALPSEDYQKITPYDNTKNQDIDKTPFIIFNSKMKAEKIDKYISPMDYTPTLLNLFDVEFDPRLYMGNDIFSNEEGLVLFPDNSWQSKDGFYNASLGEFSKEKSSKISDDKILEINKKVEKMRDRSNLAISTNYFNYLYYKLHPEEVQIESGDSTN